MQGAAAACGPAGDMLLERLSQRHAQPLGRSSAAGSSSYRPRPQPQPRRQRRTLVQAAADSHTPSETFQSADGSDRDELPLWRFLRQQGFSAACVSRLQAAVSSGKVRNSIRTGQRLTEQKLQRDVAPNIAALRAEGLDPASIERMFEQYPALLTTKHATLSSALAGLRQLAALLPDDPRAVQAPPEATQLGVALWLYPTASAHMLRQANLGSQIEGNLQLRRQLGISDAKTATAIFSQSAALVSNLERAEAMVAHLQRLQASGELSAEQVVRIALAPGTLPLAPAEFDRRWQECGLSGPRANAADISLKDPAGRQRATAEALSELLQAADGMPGPLQPQYRQQGTDLVARCRGLWTVSTAALRANWASLQRLGLSDSQIVAVAQRQPSVLAYNWQGEAKQRLLAWMQQDLGLSAFEFLLHHSSYSTTSAATLAMRADFLRQHRPAAWHAAFTRGFGPVLSLLTDTRRLSQAGCTTAELAAFNRAWLATPAGRRWGGRIRRVQQRNAKNP